MYKIEFERRAGRDLRKLPPEIRTRITTRIQSLTNMPRPRGILQIEPGTYRLRVGNYRVIYNVIDKDQVVIIIRIRRRREDTYKGI